MKFMGSFVKLNQGNEIKESYIYKLWETLTIRHVLATATRKNFGLNLHT